MRAVVVPAAPALLEAYRSITDPVPELRAACAEAVGWLVEGSGGVEVLGNEPVAGRLARQLLAGHGPGRGSVPGLLVLANGSARRGEKAPGHLDERSFAHDDEIAAALAEGSGARLAELDEHLAAELLASGVGALRELGRRMPRARARVLLDDDPFGVRYWVATWESGS